MPGVIWDDFIREEIDFHFALAGLCHNRVTMSALAALRHFVLSFSAYLPETFEGRILADWEAILGALARRDGATVKQGIREISSTSTSSSNRAPSGPNRDGPPVWEPLHRHSFRVLTNSFLGDRNS